MFKFKEGWYKPGQTYWHHLIVYIKDDKPVYFINLGGSGKDLIKERDLTVPLSVAAGSKLLIEGFHLGYCCNSILYGGKKGWSDIVTEAVPIPIKVIESSVTVLPPVTTGQLIIDMLD